MTPGVSVIAVDLVLLRTALAQDIVLRPGLTLGAKVLERSGEHGLLLLAGTPLVAKLPGDVVPGQRLRLTVTEATPERVSLQVAPDAPATAAATAVQATPTAVALPGGAAAQVLVDPDGEGEGPAGGRGGRRAAVTLRFDSPSLGRLDLRIDRDACAVHAPAGQPAALVAAAAPQLQAALVQATGRAMLITVHPRATTLDVRT